jgi:parvulin-like peptidyl-prolyl isomerase
MAFDIASVNNYKISDSEFHAELYHLAQEQQAKRITKKLKECALNQLIDACLLMQEAEKSNIPIDENEVQNCFQNLQDQFPSLEEFLKSLKKYSLSQDRLLENIRKSVQIKHFIKIQFFDKIEVTEDQLKEYYEEHKQDFQIPEEAKVCHILIRPDDIHAVEKFELIAKALADGNGDDFCELAKKYSDCTSRKNGGELGYIERGKVIKELEDAVFSLKKEEIVGPIKTRFGWHFLKLVDKRDPRIPEFDEIRHSLCKQLKKVIGELELLNFIRNLRKKAKITIYRENL